MTASKWYKNIYLYMVMVASALTLLGCVKADRKSKSASEFEQTVLGRGQVISTELLDKDLSALNNASQFRAGGIALESFDGDFDGKSYWRQDNRLNLKFKVCGLEEMRSGGQIDGQKFQIKSELGNPVNGVVEASGGCIRWTYILPINQVAPSVNLAIHFEIKSISGLGRIIRRIGLNPWDFLRKKAFNNGLYQDLTNHPRNAWGGGMWVFSADRILSALRGELLDSNARLNVKNISVQPVEKSPAGVRYEEMLESLSPEERERRRRIDRELRKQQGIFINFNLSVFPVVELTDSTNSQHVMNLDSGRFKVFMNLLAHGANGKKHIINQYVPSLSQGGGAAFTWMADAVNGIQASYPMVLKYQPTYGQMELVVKIVPVDMKDVKPFAAVYDLGQYNQWAQRKSGPPLKREAYKALSEVDFVKYIESADNYEQYKDQFVKGLGAGNDKALINSQLFYFDPLKIRFMRIMPGETATDRTFQYAVETCINHGIFGQRVGQGLQFEITTWDKGKPFTQVRQTLNNGCLTWFGFVSHKYYHKEVLEEKKARVRFVGTERSDDPRVRQKQWNNLVNKIEKEFLYYMNPWDEKFTFGWDGESLPENYKATIEKQRREAPESKLFIEDFKYETMGFRYEIDKYMNLKVKKTVLLKTYPYVLKYNSIVHGRRGTEHLRDGIYLMKVALQKDYLDPAARGIVIKDRKASDRVPEPIATKDNRPVNQQLFDDDEILRQDKKQQITIQQKLVRVLGGVIVTPIEFEVKDLRMMRIRNQFFIQLQTIDENKLRLATFLDKKIQSLQDVANTEVNYENIFRQMDKVEELDQKVVDAQKQQQVNEESVRGLQKLVSDLEEAKEGLLGLFGIKTSDTNYTQKVEEMKKVFSELDQYRKLGIDGQTAARNDKWKLINRLVNEAGDHIREKIEQSENDLQENSSNEGSDPFQRYLDISRATDTHAFNQVLSGSRSDLQDFLRNSDFTTGSLAPKFDINILANDGLKPEESGLPSRTFVGPLTFVLNTNGSPLRPTDILEEAVCLTSSCGAPEKIADGVPPAATMKHFRVDDSGRAVDLPGPVYALGDSVNANYENNKYYGYLKAYHNYTVDKLIEEREKLLKKQEKLNKTSSQIINFTSALGLKYTNIGDDNRSDLKDVDTNCVGRSDHSSVDQCFVKTQFSESKTLKKDDLLNLLNGKSYRYAYWLTEPGDRSWFTKFFLRDFRDVAPRSFFYTNYLQYQNAYFKFGEEVTADELKKLMKYGWKDSRLDAKMVKKHYHRFCYALTQMVLSGDYLKSENKHWSKKNNWNFVHGLEKKCHDQVENFYEDEGSGEKTSLPLIFERKVRVFDTTNRYVYRGGKSLNINVSANFSLSHSNGFGRNRSVSWKPTDWLEDVAGAASRFLKNVVGAFGFTVSYGDSQQVAQTDGTNISSATFLVGQQATFDIELGEYERCLVVRFHPKLLADFLKDDRTKPGFNPHKHLETLGVMMCSGERKKECLPVKEKYYYFTQHFTEGDMLDTADLHNHPWLLQLRGYRDFQAFVSMIGAKEQKYADMRTVDKYINKMGSDAATFSRWMKGRDQDNKGLEFEVVNKAEEPDWPLTALGEAYFNVLPTFPGLYTFVEVDEHQVRDWPYGNPDPNQAFQCHPSGGE